ncbi:17996_t:CDS:2 [Dentiscutata erythropus]|uniref:17996_t:CDS:1 n=1 Tax=Dentiscutata erythropus TaxID=1348616 RepID=A0A9N9C1C3_9GLOM|nr:17996_t:CDS:2 [Dentiscutata erythropus]
MTVWSSHDAHESNNVLVETYGHQIVSSSYNSQTFNWETKKSLENEPNDLLLEIDYQIVDSNDNSSTINLKNKISSHNNEESREDTLQLYIGRSFNEWKEVDKFLKLFGKLVDITKQYEKPSATINCEWHVNFNNHKGTKEIICTSLVNKHNHEMNPLVAQTAPRFYKLSEEMIKDIRFYTCSMESIGATLQYNLLKAKYPDKYIDKKDVYNAIQ